jgi:RNA recognition motif-containing protein
VTGLAQKVREEDLREVFGKYGEVQNSSIMRDPHSGDSRGFGFVKFAVVEQAEAAIEALHGTDLEGRTLSIEKARRSRPRTPTPGKYHGPPKKGKFETLSVSTEARSMPPSILSEEQNTYGTDWSMLT